MNSCGKLVWQMNKWANCRTRVPPRVCGRGGTDADVCLPPKPLLVPMLHSLGTRGNQASGQGSFIQDLRAASCPFAARTSHVPHSEGPFFPPPASPSPMSTAVTTQSRPLCLHSRNPHLLDTGSALKTQLSPAPRSTGLLPSLTYAHGPLSPSPPHMAEGLSSRPLPLAIFPVFGASLFPWLSAPGNFKCVVTNLRVFQRGCVRQLILE